MSTLCGRGLGGSETGSDLPQGHTSVLPQHTGSWVRILLLTQGSASLRSDAGTPTKGRGTLSPQ